MGQSIIEKNGMMVTKSMTLSQKIGNMILDKIDEYYKDRHGEFK